MDIEPYGRKYEYSFWPKKAVNGLLLFMPQFFGLVTAG
jgi:hypothetical protein